MPRAPFRSIILFCAATCACAASRGASPTPSAPVVAAQAPSEVLPQGARFGDLVRAAAALESAARSTGPHCLLQALPHEYRLRAELAIGLRPLPQPPEDLDEALKNAAHMELLSTWGRYGDGNGKLALVGFTNSVPTRTAYALLLTDQGVALRSASGSPTPPRDGLTLADAIAALRGSEYEPGAALFVSAEASLPVSDLYHTLEALAEARQVVLAVALSSNVSLPLPVSAQAKVARCPDGLPETSAREGSLTHEQLQTGLIALKQNAPDCLIRGDARGAAGGRLTLAMRIIESGRVQDACIREDELTDPGVLSCVISLASQLQFAPPQPSGVLDIELPIALQPSAFSVQPPICH